MSSVRVALAQILSSADPQANLELIADEARAAKDQGAQLVVFPEASMRRFGGPLAPVAEPVDGPWATRVRELAGELGLTVVVGMFSPSDEAGVSKPARGGRVRNTLLATNGAHVTAYDKIHLFDALGFVESRTVQAGGALRTIQVGRTTVGLTTCYDVRFPWLYQDLARLGAQIVVVSASWGDGPRKLEQWQLLTAARALDSTSYILACDQAKPKTSEPGVPTGVGFSRVISPFGEVLAEAADEPELLVIDLDLDVVDKARIALPVLATDAGRVDTR